MYKNVIINRESSTLVANKVDNKLFTLQFLPECLYSISENKKVRYEVSKNEKLKIVELKSDYLIDIVHNLILKYYFKKENKFALNSLVLKDKYGHEYNYYIKYLIDNNIITLMVNHLAGVTSRIYSLNEQIFKAKISRYKNYDKFLLKKYKNKFVDMIHTDDSVQDELIDSEIREKLVSDLFSVKIDSDRAIFYLDTLKYKDYDIYNRNIYSVECINDKHIFYHFDSYGRMHTNFTILKTFIRKGCLLIDGEETYERDLDNSQPLFLSKLIKDSKSKWVDKEELDFFSELVKRGKYYQFLIDKLDITKSDAKTLTYKVLFGKNYGSSKLDKKFSSLFPTIHKFIKLYKKEYDNYKVLAYKLQRMESELIFNNIIKTINNLHPHIKIITVHDSIICQAKYRYIIDDIFDEKLKEEFDI